MNKIVLSLLGVFVLTFGFSQTPTIDLSLSPTQLVEDVLAGPGVQISNAKFNDNPNYSGNRIGKFTYGGNQIDFPSGIVMGSGGVSNTAGTAQGMIGPNNNGGYNMTGTGSSVSSDAQLSSILGGSLYDIGRLEFDFVPVGNKVSFEFIFGSDEYNEYVCSNFFDVFGFFVTGPKPGGGNYTNQNLALVPNSTTPISINTINNGSVGGNGSPSNSICASGGLLNSQYFAGAPGNHFQMDGATKSITVDFDVICGQSYHFKFAIADVGDGAYDSWVFLKAGSFQSEAVQVSVATVTGDNTIIEGCTQADIIFTRPLEQSDTAMTVTYELGGNAIEGVNYQNLPNPIQFAPGEDSLVVSLIPIQDGINSGMDSVIITVKIVNQCGDTITSSGTIYILDEPDLEMTVSNPTIYCATDDIAVNALASGAAREPFTYEWSTGATTANTTVPVSIHGPFEYYVTATDDCGFSITDTVHINLEQTLMIDTLIATKTQECQPTGNLVAQVHGVTGTPVYSWKDAQSAEISTTLTASNVGGGWFAFTVKDNLCEITDSVFVETIPLPVAVIVPDTTAGCNPTTFTLSNASQNATSYVWTVNGVDTPVSNQNPQHVTMNNIAQPTQTVKLVASNGVCVDETTVTLSIIHCGCMDPLSINYDPLAVQDDGSCKYHDPVVVTPNAFTPDDDEVNEVYQFIDIDYVDEIEYWIINRWGNEMYHFGIKKPGNLIDVSEMQWWDGKMENGQMAAEGVYFVKYVAHGINGETIKGHNFFHLLRK